MRGLGVCRQCLSISTRRPGPSRCITFSSHRLAIRQYATPPDDPPSESLDRFFDDGTEDANSQQPFYDIDLDEPDLPEAPLRSFGIRQPGQSRDPNEGKMRNPYPAKITLNAPTDADGETFDEVVLELLRRKRKADAKRRQRGGFMDHVRVKVRGGKGGQGSAAFGLTTTGALGPPTGGNGGQGGSVYLTTSSGLTSLHTLRRQYLGGQGGMGAGEHRHGQRGDDVFLEVPVGTVVTEVSREGDEEKHWETAESLNTPMEERKRKRWERWFATQTGFEVETPYYAAAERLLRRERKWATRTPTFEEIPPVRIDMEAPIEEPVRIAAGGQGGVGNPFFSGLHSWKAPRLASRGVMPYTSTFELELKILADVGLVGFPNVGKSTILRALTGRRAEVAGYSFTTLNPQVGVVRVWDDGTWGGGGLSSIGGDTGVVEETWQERARDVQARENGEYMPLPRAGRVRTSRDLGTDANEIMEYEKIEAYRFTISDNPGLLPQASENVGLGHSFLRSIERSLALAYILDLKRPDPASDLMALRTELNNYKEGLPGIGSVVVLNKGDEVGPEEGKEKLAKIREVVKTLDEGGRMEVVVLSGKFGLGLQKLVKILGEKVEIARSRQQEITAETWD